jgi:hypothetical protein
MNSVQETLQAVTTWQVARQRGQTGAVAPYDTWPSTTRPGAKIRSSLLEESALPQEERGSDFRLREIVNNQGNSVWQFRCTHAHSVLGCPGRAWVMSDLMVLQRVAEPAFPPASHGGRPQKWQKWQF